MEPRTKNLLQALACWCLVIAAGIVIALLIAAEMEREPAVPYDGNRVERYDNEAERTQGAYACIDMKNGMSRNQAAYAIMDRTGWGSRIATRIVDRAILECGL